MWDVESPHPPLEHISVNIVGRVDDGEEEGAEFDEQSVLGMGEEEPIEEEDVCPQHTPVRGACEEICTPIRQGPNSVQRVGVRGMHPRVLLEKESTLPPPPPRQSLNQFIVLDGEWPSLPVRHHTGRQEAS